MALLTGIEPASPARQAGRFSRCVQQRGGAPGNQTPLGKVQTFLRLQNVPHGAE